MLHPCSRVLRTGRERRAEDITRTKRRTPMKEKIIGFFTDVVKEMKKVTWPKREELQDSTIIVLVVCLIIGAFIYVVDMVVSGVLRQIL